MNSRVNGVLNWPTCTPSVFLVHRTYASWSETLAFLPALSGHAGTSSAAVILGFGWDETGWPERRPFTRDEVDRATGGRAVFLSRVDVHSAVLSTAFLDAYQGHGALAHRAATLVGWATIMHGAVMLDLTGHRFGDETTGYSEYAAALAARPQSTGCIVLDQRIHDLCLPFTDFRQTVESG